MDKAEQDIIAACSQGDLRRFAELYDRYVNVIYRFIYYKTQHRETAEDLTSETFLKALRHVKGFQAGSFSAWLYRIARNTVIDHYRQSRPQTGIEDVWDLSVEDPNAQNFENRDMLDRVRGWLSTLPSAQRDVVILRLWEGRSYREIAEVVGKSEGNCKVIFARTLAKLRAEPALLSGLIIILLSLNDSLCL